MDLITDQRHLFHTILSSGVSGAMSMELNVRSSESSTVTNSCKTS
jgi:hypothetical protein